MNYILSYMTRTGSTLSQATVPLNVAYEDEVQEIVLALYKTGSIVGRIYIYERSKEMSEVFEADYHQLEVE